LVPYRSTKFQLKMFAAAASSILTCDCRAVEPKPSSGIRPLTMLELKVVLAKLVAASLDSIARRNSLPPARFLAWAGTT
jgi:hypothetical protein